MSKQLESTVMGLKAVSISIGITQSLDGYTPENMEAKLKVEQAIALLEGTNMPLAKKASKKKASKKKAAAKKAAPVRKMEENWD